MKKVGIISKTKIDKHNSRFEFKKDKFRLVFEGDSGLCKDGEEVVILVKRNRCFICKRRKNLTTHHPLPYHYLKMFLFRNMKYPPFNDKEHISFHRLLNIVKSEMDGDITCKRCHDKVTEILDELIKNYKRGYRKRKR